MKHPREGEVSVSLALSLSTDSSASATSSGGSSSAGGVAAKRARRRRVVATSGEGDFVCKTCNRAFPSFQALGGHRTSHLRGRGHGLELGVVGAKALKRHKAADNEHNTKPDAAAAAVEKHQHECHLCGLGFETGQALGGHMRRHREEVAAAGGGGADWVWRTQEMMPVPAAEPPVLLQLFA